MWALTHNRVIFTLALVSAAAACRGPMPCADCDSADDMQPHDMQKDPDLPCGGADFLNDGPCDEPIPWEQGFSFPTHVRCCCG